MKIAVPDLLVKDGFLSPTDRDYIERYAAKHDLSFLKVALSYGYVSRKNYARSITNAGYEFREIRELPTDEKILKEIDLNFSEAHLAIPLYIKNNKVVTVMADPTNKLVLDFIKLTYNKEPEVIVAEDLEITWMSHTLLGRNQVKAAVFDLLNHDPSSSALTTFTTPQLVFFFLLLAGLA